MALQSKLSVYLIVEDKIIDYIIYDKLIIEVDSFARRMTKLDIGSFVLTDPVISLRPCYHSITCMRACMCAYQVLTCTCVYMCICVCVCVCIPVYMCICVCTCTCAILCIHVLVYVGMLCVRTRVYVCVHVHVCVWVYIFMCSYVCICMCVVCMYNISALGLTLEELYSYVNNHNHHCIHTVKKSLISKANVKQYDSEVRN